VTTGSTTLCPGDNEATVSVSNPNNGNVQWQQFVNGAWEDILGANSNSLTVNNVTTTSQFQAVISNVSCATATSDIATITVSPVVLPPEIESLNQPICPETLGNISFINLPTPGVWTIIADPIATYTGSGSTGLFENLSPGSYTFAIDWNGCTSEFSTESAVIETPQTPTPIATSNDLTACISDLLIVDDLPVSFTGSSSIALESTPVFLTVSSNDLLVNGNYFISQTDNINGCGPSDTIIISVTIQESQIPEIIDNNFTICDSEALIIEDLGVTGNGGVLNYYYSDGTTIISANSTDNLQTGTYFVTQTGPDNSCESIDSLEITVTIGTTPPPSTANENQIFCTSDNSTVNDLSINLSSYTLNYFFDNGTSIVSVALPDVLLDGNYYITATDPNTNCTSNDSLLITVTINDTPPPTTNTPNPLFCAIDSATIEDLLVTGENILWYDNNGNLLSQTTILSDNTSYFATQTPPENGCESSSNLEIQVTVLDPPSPLSNNLTQVFCETENPTIADIVVTGTDVQWYDTELNGIPLPPNTSLIDQQSYYASQIIGGCESSEYLMVNINIQNTIDGGFFTSDSEGCSPLNIQLTPNFINANATYSWYIDDVFAGNTDILDYTFIESGCYDIQLLIDEPNSCATDVTNSDFVCVSPGPVASFYTSPNTLAINNQLVSFQNTSSNADSFIWDFGNGSTSTQINPETNINIINETLTVTLTAFSGDNCESTASITFEMPESDLYVPNSFTPDADEHNQSWGPVFLSGFDKFNFELLVFNRWGETVWESRDADGRWDGKYSNKQLNCPEGIYTWKITYKKKNSDDRTVRTGHITLIR
jgi:gliding motility-associated-like protein